MQESCWWWQCSDRCIISPFPPSPKTASYLLTPFSPSIISLMVSFRFKKVVACGHCLLTLSLTINETLKCLSSLCILMQESFWWGQCSDRYIISLFPHLHTPFSLSLISLLVPVNIKHTYLRVCYLGVSCVLVYLCLADVNWCVYSWMFLEVLENVYLWVPKSV